LIDVFFRYTTSNSVLIVAPINTIQNWENEFHRWCPSDDPNLDYKRPYCLYVLNELSKKSSQRTQIIRHWSKTGGTMIIGYEMFRSLVTRKNASTKAIRAHNSIEFDLEEEEKNLEEVDRRRTMII
jgi:SNF2 family DNA or RNA helicase